MKPLKITIQGEFWDTWIYKSKIYLFKQDGSVLTLNWREMISNLRVPEDEILAFRSAFANNNYLYSPKYTPFTSDVEVREIIRRKFVRLSKRQFSLEVEKGLGLRSRQDNPFPFPHADLEIYGDKIYSAGPSGIHIASCNNPGRWSLGKRSTQLFDCPSMSLSALYQNLTVATGSEGAFELSLKDLYRHRLQKEPKNIFSGACTNIDWMFYSLFVSSFGHGGTLLDFEKKGIDAPLVDEFGDLEEPQWQASQKSNANRSTNSIRKFREEIADRSIFSGLTVARNSWGVKDKICSIYGNKLKIAKYQPWEQERLTILEETNLKEHFSDFVSGKTAPFGVVIETENFLYVIMSNGETEKIEGSPINWRVFPRSTYYFNHMHVIYPGYLEIYSFCQDYFVDQKEKVFGTEYRANEWLTTLV